VAAEPNLRPEDPNPPRERVVLLKDGRVVADLAIRVRPVDDPALLLSAVRNELGLAAGR
jgi:hypothetical protein